MPDSNREIVLERAVDALRILQLGYPMVASYFEGGEGSNVYVKGKLVEDYTEDEWAALLDEYGVERHPTRRELDQMIRKGEIG